MIDYFETSVRIAHESSFLTYCTDEGEEIRYTYWQTRLISAALAKRLLAKGARQGDGVYADISNTPEFVFVALACAYANLTLILPEAGLSEGDKLTRRLAVERAGVNIAFTVDDESVSQVLGDARKIIEDDADLVQKIFKNKRHSRSIMGEKQDAIDDVVHFAERAAHLFDRNSEAVIFFSRDKNRPETDRTSVKLVPLTWSQLLEEAATVSETLSTGASRLWQERLPFNSFSDSGPSVGSYHEDMQTWQCVLPMSSIMGFTTLVNSLVGMSPLYLYAPNSHERILHDAEFEGATHIAVDDEQLQELITIEEWRDEATPGVTSRLSCYQCILLVGNVQNPRTVRRAFDLGGRIFVAYGMPQTGGIIAISRVNAGYDGGVYPIKSYEFHIVDPDEDGWGSLAVRGPGVFNGYLGARTPFTVDGFFITRDVARMEEGRIFFRNPAEKMFVSNGQSIYPMEIADVLRHVSGVAGVHVFGVEDSRCGMLPVAVLERSDPQLTPDDVERTTRPWFSSMAAPISIFVFDKLPRNDSGKLDKNAIEAIFQS